MKEAIGLAANPQNYGKHIAFFGIKTKVLRNTRNEKTYISKVNGWMSDFLYKKICSK